MDVAIIIVAAGQGTRAGGDVPKQYQPIAGTPLLQHTMMAALSCDLVDAIQVVIDPDMTDLYQPIEGAIADGRVLPVAPGGATRTASTKAGLGALAPYKPKRVLIHDAARPFVDARLIGEVIAALNGADAAFPTLPVMDALWHEGTSLTPIDRTPLRRAQTPQGFDYQKAVLAFENAPLDAKDDIEVAIKAGLSVAQVMGSEQNTKITLPQDFERAKHMVQTAPDIRTGNGFDVHAFCDGDGVWLCGIKIPFEQALKGHSDADVAMHAITDAIYGALAEGDIGTWFPPSEAQWKGAASHIFLEHAMARAAANGFTVSNIDCTIICEQPKIGPHATAMREELSKITGLEVARISVKATTSEQLGFTGRREGIACNATATLVGSTLVGT